jgi:hypothetical protein
MLLLSEEQRPACSKAIGAEAAGTSLDAELWAIGGITAYNFTSSVDHREIFGLGGQSEASALTLRLPEHRCGSLTPSQQANIQALSLAALETSPLPCSTSWGLSTSLPDAFEQLILSLATVSHGPCAGSNTPGSPRPRRRAPYCAGSQGWADRAYQGHAKNFQIFYLKGIYLA